MKLRALVVGLLAGSLALTACGQSGSPGGSGAPVVSNAPAADVQVASACR